MSDRKQSQRQASTGRFKPGNSSLSSHVNSGDIFDSYRQRIISCYRNRVQNVLNSPLNPQSSPTEEQTKSRVRQRRRGTETTYSPMQNEEIHEVICNICLLSNYVQTNDTHHIMQCTNCHITFHKECYYGINNSNLVEEGMICDMCTYNKKNATCIICSTGNTNGMLRKAKNGDWIHIFCAITNNFPMVLGNAGVVFQMEGIKSHIPCQICHTTKGLVKQCNSCTFTCHTNCAGAQNQQFYIENKKAQFQCHLHENKVQMSSDDDLLVLDMVHSNSSSNSSSQHSSQHNSLRSSHNNNNNATSQPSTCLKMIASDISTNGANPNQTHTIQAFTQNQQNIKFVADNLHSVRQGDINLPTSDDTVLSHLLQLIHKKSSGNNNITSPQANSSLHASTISTNSNSTSANTTGGQGSSLHRKRLARAALSSRRTKNMNSDILPVVDTISSLHACLDLMTSPLTGENLITIGSYLPLLQQCVQYKHGVLCVSNDRDIWTLHVQSSMKENSHTCTVCECDVDEMYSNAMSDGTEYTPTYLPSSLVFTIPRVSVEKYGVATFLAPSGDDYIWAQVKKQLLDYDSVQTITNIDTKNGKNNHTTHYQLPYLTSAAVDALMSMRTISQYNTQNDPALLFPCGQLRPAQYFLSSTILHPTPKHISLSVGQQSYKDLTPTGIYTDGHVGEDLSTASSTLPMLSTVTSSSQAVLSQPSLDSSASIGVLMTEANNGTIDIQNTSNWSLQILPNIAKIAKMNKDGYANTSVTSMVPAAILDSIHGVHGYTTNTNTQKLMKQLGMFPENTRDPFHDQRVFEISHILQPHQLYPSVLSGTVQRTGGHNQMVEYVLPPLASFDYTNIHTKEELYTAFLTRAVLSRTNSVVDTNDPTTATSPVKYQTPGILIQTLRNIIQTNVPIPSIQTIMDEKYASYVQPRPTVENQTPDSIAMYDHTNARIFTPSVLDFARKHEYLGEWSVFNNTNLYEKEGQRLFPSVDEQAHIRLIDDYAAWNSLLVHQQPDAFSTMLTKAVDDPASIIDHIMTDNSHLLSTHTNNNTNNKHNKRKQSKTVAATIQPSTPTTSLPAETDEVSVSLLYLQHLQVEQMRKKEDQFSNLRKKITFSHTSVVFWEYRTYMIRLLANQRQLHAWQNLVKRLCANVKDIQVSATHCRNIVLLSLRATVASKVHEYHGFVKMLNEEIESVMGNADSSKNQSQDVISQMTVLYREEMDMNISIPDSTEYTAWLLHARGIFTSFLDIYNQYLQHILSLTETLHKGMIPDIIYPYCNNVALLGLRGSLEVDPRSCSICFDLSSYDDDPLLQCEYCHTSVHRNCYGLGWTNINPSVDWTCVSCASYKRYTAGGKHSCALCPLTFGCMKPADQVTEDLPVGSEKLGSSMLNTLTKYNTSNTSPVGGPATNASNQTWVHPVCALWCNDVTIADIAQMELITGVKEAVRQNTQTCALCNNPKGVVVKCCADACQVYMHPLCGWFGGNVLSATTVAESLKLQLNIYCISHTEPKHVTATYPTLLIKQMPLLRAIAMSFTPTIQPNNKFAHVMERTITAMKSNYAEIYTVAEKDGSSTVTEDYDDVQYHIPIRILERFRLLLQQEMRLRYRATQSSSLSSQQRNNVGFSKMKKKVFSLTNQAHNNISIDEISFVEDTYDPNRCAVCFKVQKDITAEGVWSAALVTLMETSYHSYLHHYKSLVLQYNTSIKHTLLTVSQNHQYTVPENITSIFDKCLDRNTSVASRLKLPFLVSVDDLVAALPSPVNTEVYAAARQQHVPHFDNNFVNTRVKPSMNLAPGAGVFLSPWELYHAARRRALSVFGADKQLQCAECHVSMHQSCYGVTQEALESYFQSGDITMKWYCDVCSQQQHSSTQNSSSVDRHTCVLCPRKGGALKLVTGQTHRYAHVVCALWTPHVSFVCPTTKSGILQNKYSYKLYKNHRCYVCLRGGATNICNVADCPHSYHYLCNAFAGGYSNITLDVPSLTNATAVTLCVAHTPLQLSRTHVKYNKDVQLLSSTKSALMQVIKNTYYDEHFLGTINNQISTLLYQYEIAIKRNLLCYVPSTVGSLPLANEIARIIKQSKLSNASNNNANMNADGSHATNVLAHHTHNQSDNRLQVNLVNQMLLSQQLLDLPLLTLGSVAIASIRAATCLCGNRGGNANNGNNATVTFCVACNSPHLPLQNITLAHIADTAAIKLHMVEPVVQPNPLYLQDNTAPSHVYCHPGVVSNAVRMVHGPIPPTDHDFSSELNFQKNIINDPIVIAQEEEELQELRKTLLSKTPVLEVNRSLYHPSKIVPTSIVENTSTITPITPLPVTSMVSHLSNNNMKEEGIQKQDIHHNTSISNNTNIQQPKLQPTSVQNSTAAAPTPYVHHRKKRALEMAASVPQRPQPVELVVSPQHPSTNVATIEGVNVAVSIPVIVAPPVMTAVATDNNNHTKLTTRYQESIQPQQQHEDTLTNAMNDANTNTQDEDRIDHNIMKKDDTPTTNDTPVTSTSTPTPTPTTTTSYNTQHATEDAMSPLKKKKVVKPFAIGDRPTLEEDGVRHTVIVKKVDMNNGDPKYEVHYHNWSSRYDRWVPHKDLSL